MNDLTFQEILILIIAICLVVFVIIGLVKCSLKLIGVGIIIFISFSIFTWVPEKIAEWTNTEPINTEEILNESKDHVVNWIENDGQSWLKAAENLWLKLTGK